MFPGSVTICDGCDGILDTDRKTKIPTRFRVKALIGLL